MQRRLDHIDGLRGLAALAVVVQHAGQFVQNAGAPHYRYLLDSINLGRFGVVLFFLISGLVIPFSFRGERPLRDFFIGRAVRLYPAYWLSIPVLGILAYYRGIRVDPAVVLSNLTMFQGLWHRVNIGPGYWTLTYEASFYMICAALFACRLLDNIAVNALAVLGGLAVSAAMVAAAVRTGHGQAISNAPYFVAMFFLGMLLRRGFVDGSAAALRWSAVLAPLTMAVGLMLSGWLVPVTENANAYLRPVALSAGMVLPVLVFVLALWLKPVPPKAVMYLASISYSLYLFQDIGLVLLPRVLPPGEWPIVFVLAVIVQTGVIAALVHRFVELPMIGVGKRLTGRAARPEKAPSDA